MRPLERDKPELYAVVINDIQRWKPTQVHWEYARALCGLAIRPRRTTPKAHIAWLKRKASRGEGLAAKHERFHSIIHIMSLP